MICVGNLSVGGTGKSPHIEYLIKLLKDYIHVGVLSRGYRRKSFGHIQVESFHTALEVGDESKMMKLKFPDVPIAVNKNRSLGIPKLLKDNPQVETVLLDDAFQHFEVKPFLNILLTEYSNPYFNDYLLPSGRLREWRYGHQRAQIVIVSKCQSQPDKIQELAWREKLRLKNSQHLFFSTIQYGIPYNIFEPSEKFVLNESAHLLMISAIAQSSYLSDYLMQKVGSLTEYNYEDHHYFSEQELQKIIDRYQAIQNYNKWIISTEKDATRLKIHERLFKKNNIKIFAIPIEIEFYKKQEFDQLIKDYLLSYKS